MRLLPSKLLIELSRIEPPFLTKYHLLRWKRRLTTELSKSTFIFIFINKSFKIYYSLKAVISIAITYNDLIFYNIYSCIFLHFLIESG